MTEGKDDEDKDDDDDGEAAAAAAAAGDDVGGTENCAAAVGGDALTGLRVDVVLIISLRRNRMLRRSKASSNLNLQREE